MKKVIIKRRHFRVGVLAAFLAAVLAVSLACASAEPTPAPVAPAQPAAPVAPAAVPQPTVALVPGAPTPIPAKATPTRVLPTATPLAMGGPKYGGNLIFAYEMTVFSLDTHYSKDVGERPVYYALYNTMVKYATDFSIHPELVKAWTVSGDGKTVTFELQPGVKFHNGEDFNAQTVKWNYDRLLREDDPVRLRTTAAFALDSVSVVDNLTVNFNMKFPYRPLLSDIGERIGFQLAPGAVETLGGGYAADGGDFSKAGVGTGPFKFVEWIPGNRIVLERFDDYWEDGKPYLDKITFLHIADPQVRLAMVRTGDADIIDDVRVQDVPVLEANANVKVYSIDTGKWAGLRLSVDREPWSNKNLKLAMAHAIDRQTLVDTYYGGAAVPAYSSERGSWAFDPTIQVYKYDIPKAKQLLVQAGYPNGVTLPIWCRSTTSESELCEVIQAMMAEAGINLEINSVVPADAWQGFLRRDFHFAPTTWRPRADPHGRLFRIYHPEGPSNIPKWNNPEVRRLLDEAVTKYDIAAAAPLYHQALGIITEDGWHIYTVYLKWYAAANTRVQNYELFPDLMERLRFLWLE